MRNYTILQVQILYLINMKCFFSFLLLAQICFEKNPSINGFVKDKDTGEPVSFAHIFLANTTSGTISDTNGILILSIRSPNHPQEASVRSLWLPPISPCQAQTLLLLPGHTGNHNLLVE